MRCSAAVWGKSAHATRSGRAC